jgi:hypothetical protein
MELLDGNVCAELMFVEKFGNFGEILQMMVALQDCLVTHAELVI